MEKNNNTSNSNEISFQSGNFNDIEDEFGNNSNNENHSFNSIIYIKDPVPKKKTKMRYYICENCKSCVKIIFEDNLLNVYCDCKDVLNLTLKDFNDKYSHKEISTIKQFLFCKKHKSDKSNKSYKYKFYCIDDRINLCEECLNVFKRHENHSGYYFSSKEINNDIKSIKDIIKDIREKTQKGDDCRGRLNIIESVLECYKNFPCNNLFESIKSGKKYLETLKIKKVKERLKINSIIDLEKNIKKAINFKEINISKQKFNDLSIFKELELENLKILILNENDLTNIDPLLDCNFKELKEIHLEGNKLNYQSMKNFEKMRFENIKFINLYINEIESPKIFEKIMNFNSLKKFYVCQNKFSKEEIIKNGNTKYDLSHLKRIGLTGNFTNENIFFILNLKLTDLKFIYLNKNNLSSLSFLKDMD